MPGAPRLLLISGGLCSIAAVMLAVAAVRAPAATRLDYLHVTPAMHVAGAVRQGERIESSFRLTNVSSEVIEILALHPSCSCTLTAMTEKRLSPGESTIVSLETGVGTARGEVVTHLPVIFQAEGLGERRSVDLIVKAMVEPDFEVSPSLLRLGGDGKGVQTVSLRSTKWLPQLKVTNAHGNRHWLSVQEIRQVEENEV